MKLKKTDTGVSAELTHAETLWMLSALRFAVGEDMENATTLDARNAAYTVDRAMPAIIDQAVDWQDGDTFEIALPAWTAADIRAWRHHRREVINLPDRDTFFKSGE